MKIGLYGAQSTGKTTLLNALAGEPVFKEFAICTEVTRWVKALGLPINEHGDDATQVMIALKHVSNLMRFDKMITDRTLLDGWCYATWSYRRGNISTEIYKSLEDDLNDYMDKYNFIFYIKPEFKVVQDGVRSTSSEFYDEVVEIFEENSKKYNNIHHITGSVSDRIQQVKDIILGELLK